MGASSVRHTHLKPLWPSRSAGGWNEPGHGKYPWVNTLGPDLRSPTPFEGLINANDERTIRDECFGKRAQQYAACFLTGPHGYRTTRRG